MIPICSRASARPRWRRSRRRSPRSGSRTGLARRDPPSPTRCAPGSTSWMRSSGTRCPPWPPISSGLFTNTTREQGAPARRPVSTLAADLEAAPQDDMPSRLLDEAPHRARVTADETREVLALVAQAIPPVLADDVLRALRAQLESFGLHAAR